MKSSNNGKQRDRVASYTGMLKRVNGGEPPAQVHDKKKPYRARGCRGGQSRKGRNSRKNHSIAHSRQNEENDPSRVNNYSYDPSRVNNYSYVKNTGTRKCYSDHTKLNTEVLSDNKVRTLSILPSGSELNVYQGTSGHITESTIEINILDRTQQLDGSLSSKCERALAPLDVLQNRAAKPKTKNVTGLSEIDRPASASSTADGNGGGGFSFFCISPRSFLSGRKSRSQKNH